MGLGNGVGSNWQPRRHMRRKRRKNLVGQADRLLPEALVAFVAFVAAASQHGDDLNPLDWATVRQTTRTTDEPPCCQDDERVFDILRAPVAAESITKRGARHFPTVRRNDGVDSVRLPIPR